jgi:hypothetical protein
MEPIKDSLEDLLDRVAFEIAQEVEAGRHSEAAAQAAE